MKLWEKKLTPKQVRFLLYKLNVEYSDSTIYRHSKKFDWEITNDQSYDDWVDDCYTIIVLKNKHFFEAITPIFSKEILEQ